MILGNRIEVWLDGKKMIEVVDSPFTEARMVGLWTKAEAATSCQSQGKRGKVSPI